MNTGHTFMWPQGVDVEKSHVTAIPYYLIESIFDKEVFPWNGVKKYMTVICMNSIFSEMTDLTPWTKKVVPKEEVSKKGNDAEE